MKSFSCMRRSGFMLGLCRSVFSMMMLKHRQ